MCRSGPASKHLGKKRLIQGTRFQMNVEQSAVASSRCGFVQEQNADWERIFVDLRNFGAGWGLRDHLVLV